MEKTGAKKSAFGSGKKFPKKKICSFCVNKVEEINYITLAKEIEKSDKSVAKEDKLAGKETEKRPRYITEKGKIIPRRMSGACVKHQHMLAAAIKRAREMALLPFKAE
jgi:small subunit ribosomal protein S18